MIREAISKAAAGRDLSEAEMTEVMEEIMTGAATPSQIGSFLTAMRMKGETVEEITGAARVMRAKARKVHPGRERPQGNGQGQTGFSGPVLDTCGTGGDGSGTFNVSTAAALVAAGGGVRVAKHGNRAVSSRCGSADVLSELGVCVEIAAEDMSRCISEVGIGFLFAPLYHEAMRYAALPRKEIGLRTLFNLLGPLTNPAGANVQVLGVYDCGLTEKVARVLGRLGVREAFVVWGEGGVDEISIHGPTRVSHLKGGAVRTFEITPEALGLERAEASAVRGGDARRNAEIIRRILEGRKGPCRDMVLMNAAAAFVAAGKAESLQDGVGKACDVIDTGKALEKLEALVQFTQRVFGKERTQASGQVA